MSEHAVYAPSSAHRWAAESGCTASAQGIAALAEQEEGEEAAEGTAAHEEIERCLSAAAHFSNGMQPLPVNPNHPAAYGIALLLSYVKQLPADGSKMWIEQRVRLTDDIWGRCDVAHWHAASATLTIVDYKNGYVGVDAEENEQLRIYAAASIYTHNLPAKWIRYAVVQPNDFRPVPRVKQWPETVESLMVFAERVARIPNGPLTFVASEKCKYCPLFGRCPATADVLVRLGAAMAYAPDQVPDAQWALFAAMKKPIEDWFKNGDKAKTKKALTTGVVPPGMKLVMTSKHRAWKPGVEEALKESIVALHGVAALELPTPAQAEKLSGIDVDALSDKPEGGPALAFDSDKRPAYERKSAAKMFEGVTINPN